MYMSLYPFSFSCILFMFYFEIGVYQISTILILPHLVMILTNTLMVAVSVGSLSMPQPIMYAFHLTF